MNDSSKAFGLSKRLKTLVSALFVVALAFGSLSLAACGGSSSNEQDNCYGDDMPVVNE